MSTFLDDPREFVLRHINVVLNFSISTKNLFSLWTEENQLELRDTFLHMMDQNYDPLTKISSYPYEKMVKDCEGYEYVSVTYYLSGTLRINLLLKAVAFTEPDPCVCSSGKGYALDSVEPLDLGDAHDYIAYLQYRYKGIMSIERGEGKQYRLFNKVALPKSALKT
jgi:hypothetical protein